MKVGILLFPGVTALDAIGPYEVLTRVPDWQITFVAAEPGQQETDSGVAAITAEASFADLQTADILLVPGGPGSRTAMTDETTLDW
jgi:putative intracellular protease/amidase